MSRSQTHRLIAQVDVDITLNMFYCQAIMQTMDQTQVINLRGFLGIPGLPGADGLPGLSGNKGERGFPGPSIKGEQGNYSCYFERLTLLLDININFFGDIVN
jgi:hypothetical protein